MDEFGFSNGIELVGSSGEIVFTSFGGGGGHHRFRAPVGGSPIAIGTSLGRPIYLDGQLHVMIGATLLRVD